MKGLKTLGCLLALLLAAVILFPATARAADVAINSTNFPDAGFRAYINKEIDDGDGVLTAAEIKAVKEIELEEASCSNLKGIEYFTSLKELNCSSNELTSLNVSALTKLEELDCSNNELTSLNVSALTKLEELDCSFNSISSLNVSKNTALIELNCNSNKLTTLNVASCTKLKSLNCGGNKLTSLNVTKNTALKYLFFQNNSVKTLDVSKNPELTSLVCYYNKLTKVDISNNPLVRILYTHGNDIAELDVHLQKRLVWAYTKPDEGSTEYKESGIVICHYYDWDAPIEDYDLDEDEDVGDEGLHCVLEYDITTKILCKPKITSPKAVTKKTVNAGDKVSLKVTAKSAVTMTYQWYYRKGTSGTWTKVTAASGKKATYTFTAANKHNGYQYMCKVTNKYGGTNSKVFKLTVKPLPKITSPTTATTKTVSKGKAVTFKVTVTGADKYQWYYRTSKTGSWKTVAAASGKTAAYKLFHAAAKHNGYQYRCKVYNATGGYVYSKIFTLKVK